MAETKQELEDEVVRLRLRVQELEKEREAETKGSKKGSKSSESARNISNRAADEGSGVIRGVALAGVETVRLAGSVLSSFADTVSQRNRPEEKDSNADLTRDLPKDIYSGVLNAVEQTLDMPGKVIDKLQEGYKETKEHK
jgi:hypothetical protein